MDIVHFSFVYIYICIDTRTHTYVPTYTYVYTYAVDECIHIQMYLHTSIHIHTCNIILSHTTHPGSPYEPSAQVKHHSAQCTEGTLWIGGLLMPAMGDVD
jgi:hypothetical protein